MRDYNSQISRNTSLFSKKKSRLGRRLLLITLLCLACGSISYGLIDGFHHETLVDTPVDLAVLPTKPSTPVTTQTETAVAPSTSEALTEIVVASSETATLPETAAISKTAAAVPNVVNTPLEQETVEITQTLFNEAPALLFSDLNWINNQPSPPMAAIEVAIAAETETHLTSTPFKIASINEATPVLPVVRKITISKGDYLGRIFAKEKLPASELASIQQTKHSSYLNKIRPGQKLELSVLPHSSDSDNNTLQRLSLSLDTERQLVIEVDSKGHFSSYVNETELELAILHQHGVVDSSLYTSMTRSGIPYKLAVELGQIFESTLDFNRDVRKGDRYALVYETFLRNGKVVKTGNILAAEYTNRGRIHQAVRYTDATGSTSYFTPKGDSLKQAFARYPLKFTRISSRFSRTRKHPILGIRQPHLGVDFAAPTGTPIISSGDGKVIHIGNKGGYGRTIIVQHSHRYTTLYAHMSRYARGLKKGDKVRHGQVIGYVGSTGVSTGPHLHYEFHVNGVHQDPLKVALPNSKPIDKSQLASFTKNTKELLAMLGSGEETLLASSKSVDQIDTSRQQ